MKKVIIGLILIGSLLFLNACSKDEPDPTLFMKAYFHYEDTIYVNDDDRGGFTVYDEATMEGKNKYPVGDGDGNKGYTMTPDADNCYTELPEGYEEVATLKTSKAKLIIEKDSANYQKFFNECIKGDSCDYMYVPTSKKLILTEDLDCTHDDLVGAPLYVNANDKTKIFVGLKGYYLLFVPED